MKKQLTFLQKLGFGRPKLGRPAQEREVKFYWGDLTKIGGLEKKRPEKVYPYSKREQKISLATVGGAGVGFVVGGLTGGILGMMAGVPIGTFAGNTIANKTIKQSGRKSFYHPSYFKRLTTTREDLLVEKDNLYRMERARVKSERNAPVKLYAKRRVHLK